MALSAEAAAPAVQRRPTELAGGWEIGLLVLLVALYAAGSILNPSFFGGADAFHALLRDTARYGVMAVGMTFVIVNKDLDLSVGSTYGLICVVFAKVFAPGHFDMGIPEALLACLVLGAFIGVANGVLVTWLKVPAFIATLTTLLIGRWPAAINRAFSHGGDGAIVTSSNRRAVKRGHRSESSTSMCTPSTAPGVPGSSVHGGGASGAPVAAWTSRAMP